MSAKRPLLLKLFVSIACLALGSLGVVPVSAQDQPPASAQAKPKPKPCSGPEYRQFDFWLGDWAVHSPAGKKQGENRVVSLLGGCVVQENWVGEQGSVGHSYNMYSNRDHLWHQTWVDNGGLLLQLAGGIKDGSMVMRGTLNSRDGEPVLHEVSWTPLEDGDVRQHWRASKDDGKTWQDIFIGIYSKK
jgi:hypothetical protein